MVSTRVQLVPAEHRKVSAGVNPCTTITVHETGNRGRGADAAAHANLQARGNSRSASWHATVDDTEAVVSYPNTARCWHAGRATGNNTSYSVEVCVNLDGNQAQAWRNAAEFVAAKLRELGLTPAAVVQHNHWSGKNCPERLRGGADGLAWAGFISMVTAAYQGGATVTPAQPPTPAPSPAAQAQASAPTTYAALAVDGVWGPVTTTALQVLMREIGRYSGAIDGQFGPLTIRAVQEWLTGLGHYTGAVDGVWGPLSRAALQRFLRTKGLYAGRIDGDAGPLTVKALQGYLNAQRTYLSMPVWDPGLPSWVDSILIVALIASPILTSLITRGVKREVADTRAAVGRAEGHAKSAAESAGVAASETTRNHGSSLKDAVDRIERDMRHVIETQARQEVAQTALARDVGGLRSEMRQEREERADLARRVTSIERH